MTKVTRREKFIQTNWSIFIKYIHVLLGGRGGKRSHKGQKRHFTSEDEIRAQQEKEEKEKAWRVSMTGNFHGIHVT